MNLITTILFDLDGVLADSEPMWNDIDTALLAEHGIVYKGEHKGQVLGKNFPMALQFYKDTFKLRPEIEELSLRRQTIATDYYAQHIPIFADVPAVMAALKEMNLRIGLATSSLRALVMPFLTRHDLLRFFDATVTGEEVKRGKPNPDIYLRAAEKVGSSAPQCLVIEDALAGIAAGKSAGMRVVAIPDPRFMDLVLYEGKADFQISRLGELPSLVQSLANPTNTS